MSVFKRVAFLEYVLLRALMMFFLERRGGMNLLKVKLSIMIVNLICRHAICLPNGFRQKLTALIEINSRANHYDKHKLYFY